MSDKKKPMPGPDSVPFLEGQPIQGMVPDAFDMVNRYGTYEIQPTSDSENFFPIIAAGRYDKEHLHMLRHQTDIGNDREATHDLTEDSPFWN